LRIHSIRLMVQYFLYVFHILVRGRSAMTPQVRWYLGGRIVYALLQGDTLSLRELKDLNERLLPFMRQSGTAQVHVIIDASSVKRIQPNPSGASQTLSYTGEHALGRSVVITSEALTTQVKKLWGSLKVNSFTSLEEGLFFLEDVDDTLLARV
jgi:hypothetical protein